MKKTVILGALLSFSVVLYGCGTDSSIGSIWSDSGILKCTFTQEWEKTTAYIKWNIVYMEGTMQDGSLTKWIVKDDTMYIWSDGTPQGLKFDFSTLTWDDFKIGEKVIKTTKDLIEWIKLNSQDCAESVIDATNFTLPTTVTFQGGL